MPNTIAKEREQDEYRVLTSRCQAICDLLVRHDPFHEAFLLHLTKSAGEDPRRQPGVVAQDLSEPSRARTALWPSPSFRARTRRRPGVSWRRCSGGASSPCSSRWASTSRSGRLEVGKAESDRRRRRKSRGARATCASTTSMRRE